VLTFFGLRPEDKESLVLEPTFILMYYGGFTYKEAYNIPVQYKKWFIDRIVKEMTKGNDGEGASQSRAAHQNSPETRALMGMARTESPARLRRFS